MYRSVQLLRATAPLVKPARSLFRPLPLQFKRVISTTPIRFKEEPITGDRDRAKDKHNVENQNYTTTAKEEVGG